MIRQRAYAQIMSKVQLLTTSGQVRTLSLVSYLFSVWISYQAATVITVDTFIWLNFHHVSSPLVVLTTVLKRGARVGIVECTVALVADVILLLTSLVSVFRCLDSQQASNDCPIRLVQHSWIVLFAVQHSIIASLEVFSLFAYQNLLDKELSEFEVKLQAADGTAAEKLLVTEAKANRYRIAAGVERRLSIFALVPGIFYWVFVQPMSYGVLCTIAGARLLRDAYGIWSSYRVERNTTNTQREFFDTITTVLSGMFLVVSLVAWAYCEQYSMLTEEFSYELLFDGAKNAYDNPFGFFSSSLDTAISTRPEPWLLLFAFQEALVLANKNSTTRL